MPALGIESGKMVVLAPDLAAPHTDQLWNAVLSHGGSMWAKFILGGDRPPYTPKIANVSMIGVNATVRSMDVETIAALRKLERRADGWWMAVESWVEVLSGQDIKRIGPAKQLWHNGTRLQFVPLNEEERLESALQAATPDVSGIANHGQMRASFIHAGNGQLPPDEWLFLRDARSLHRAGEYRRALIDVGSAAEVALARIVENELARKGMSADDIRSKFGNWDHKTLGQKARHVEDTLKLKKLPRDFKSVVVDRRNDAVHLRPTRKIDAERAIAKATKLVERATPLASLIPPA